MKQNWSREYVIDKLHNHVCRIQFEKKDGTFRNASATLKTEFLPGEGFVVRETYDTRNPNVIKYYDIEEGQWKSFILDKLLDIGIDVRYEDEPTESEPQTDEILETYLVVDGQVYTIEQVVNTIEDTRWYADDKQITVEAIQEIVKLLRNQKTVEQWKQAVMNGDTELGFEEWKDL